MGILVTFCFIFVFNLCYQIITKGVGQGAGVGTRNVFLSVASFFPFHGNTGKQVLWALWATREAFVL